MRFKDAITLWLAKAATEVGIFVGIILFAVVVVLAWHAAQLVRYRLGARCGAVRNVPSRGWMSCEKRPSHFGPHGAGNVGWGEHGSWVRPTAPRPEEI